jgi:hypothetical protein
MLSKRRYTGCITIITTYRESNVRKKVNYLNNKDMLMEIHKSKLSFCEYSDEKYGWFDHILDSVDEINDETIAEAKKRRAARIADLAYRKAMFESESLPRPKLSEFKFDPETIDESELVFRVITYEHIPLAPGRKKNPKTVADDHIRLNFIPFKHYILEGTGNARRPVEVLKSHYYKGEFNHTHGSITDKLARMFMLMVNKYSQRSNWRGYTYLDEMKGQALLQLSQMGLQFNEAKSDNPFSYYTASVSNSFTRVLNIEKKNQNLRDDLLVQAGQSPSYTRQLAIEEEIRKLREDAILDTD